MLESTSKYFALHPNTLRSVLTYCSFDSNTSEALQVTASIKSLNRFGKLWLRRFSCQSYVAIESDSHSSPRIVEMKLLQDHPTASSVLVPVDVPIDRRPSLHSRGCLSLGLQMNSRTLALILRKRSHYIINSVGMYNLFLIYETMCSSREYQLLTYVSCCD